MPETENVGPTTSEQIDWCWAERNKFQHAMARAHIPFSAVLVVPLKVHKNGILYETDMMALEEGMMIVCSAVEKSDVVVRGEQG